MVRRNARPGKFIPKRRDEDVTGEHLMLLKASEMLSRYACTLVNKSVFADVLQPDNARPIVDVMDGL
jgi:hypothetical protein